MKNMLKTKTILITILLLNAGIASVAQTDDLDEEELTTEQEDAEMAYERLLPSTAQILVIDSTTADKTDFIDKIPLNDETGRISTYDKQWNTSGQPFAYTYVNGFGNKIIFAQKGEDGHYALYTADKLNGEWANKKRIDDFGDEFEDVNYPFMMPDGVTLYFAAKGGEGLGGYDIYVTRYDIGSERFYTPENIGLPYNSAANDYYCITDEFNNLGWIVTDRRQPNDTVCIYTFVPTKERKTYDESVIGEEKLRSLADLACIQDTWYDNGEIQAARDRLAAMLTRKRKEEKENIMFVVNDHTIYETAEEFKSPKNRERFAELQEMRKAACKAGKDLENMRLNYSKGTAATKRKLSAGIIKAEKQIEELNAYIHTLEKDIRNTENMMQTGR